MKLIRYQTSPVYHPLANPSRFRNEIDRLFDVALPTLSLFQREGAFGDWQGEFPIDLYQEKEAFIIRAELPGFRKEDIKVEIADGTLTLTGYQKTEKAPDPKQKEDQSTTQERRVTRSISLPENLKLDQIEAGYENGILTVTLPKREEIKPKQITIEVK